MLTTPLGRTSRRAATTVLAVVTTLAGGLLVAPAIQASPGQTSVSGVASAPQQEAKRYFPREGVTFNVPREGQAQYRIERHIIEAINKARPKSVIKMSMFSFDRYPVADALVRAKRRGVKVRVLVNNHEMTGAQGRLRSVLGNNRNKGSWWFQCKSSCRGQGDVNHSKFILFTKTGGAKYTTMVGSMNMKTNGTDNQFNDLFTENFQQGLYRVYDKVFNEMSRDEFATPMYVRKNIANKFQVHVLPFPRAPRGTSKNRYTVGRDPMNQILRPIQCTKANVPSGRTAIRVNMHAWDGDRGAMLANRFRDLYARGCDVKIMVGFAGRRVREIFAQRTRRGFVPIRSTGFDTNGDRQIDKYSHEKTLMVNGHYYSKKGRRFIVTGSANHQDGGQYGDEIIMRVDGNRLHKAYVDNWNVKWNRYTHGFSFGRQSLRTESGEQRTVPFLFDGLGTDSPEWQNP